jgi:hypothetical protein
LRQAETILNPYDEAFGVKDIKVIFIMLPIIGEAIADLPG